MGTEDSHAIRPDFFSRKYWTWFKIFQHVNHALQVGLICVNSIISQVCHQAITYLKEVEYVGKLTHI